MSTCKDEHNAKVKFIAAMSNKYDYAAYRQFCLDNNYEVMSFVSYALLIEPPVPRTFPQPARFTPPDAAVAPKPCGGCGGGIIR